MRSNEPLKSGDTVKIRPRGVGSFRVIGISEGGTLAFLQPMAFLNRPRNEHAITWPSDDLVKVS